MKKMYPTSGEYSGYLGRPLTVDEHKAQDKWEKEAKIASRKGIKMKRPFPQGDTKIKPDQILYRNISKTKKTITRQTTKHHKLKSKQKTLNIFNKPSKTQKKTFKSGSLKACVEVSRKKGNKVNWRKVELKDRDGNIIYKRDFPTDLYNKKRMEEAVMKKAEKLGYKKVRW